MKRVDVVVVGASLAGSACVRELQRHGVDALAIERAVFPADKVCGGFLSPGAVAILQEMELDGVVRSAGAVGIHRARIHAGDGEVVLELPTPGLSISRATLDAIVASGMPHRRASVEKVVQTRGGFEVLASGETVQARVVVDASGKLSRFSRGHATRHFGIQFFGPAAGDAGTLHFWFFREGYGGIAPVENGRSNACFLIDRDALPRYLNRPGCRVTGPLTYAREPLHMIAVGDAAGMIDPFCGEGMRHALDSGREAARVIAQGFAQGHTYDRMLGNYAAAWKKRWSRRRRLAASVRGMLCYPPLVERGLDAGAHHLLKTFWK